MISKSALYALRASVVLAQLPIGTFATAAHVADACGAPPKYLCKLLEVLTRRNLIRSQKGLHGGYALARSPEDITVFEIVDAIDGISLVPECLLGRPQCTAAQPCRAHRRWRLVRDVLARVLTTTTLADLIPEAESTQVAAGGRPT